MFSNILVVCVGNVCRSPTGEQLLKRYLPDKEIHSAGIHALVGKGADLNAINVARAKSNLSLENHTALQLTKELCIKYDLILVMEKKNINPVCHIAPEVRGKIMLFGHWLNEKEITDPYKKSIEVFEFVYDLLDDAAQKWALNLNH